MKKDKIYVGAKLREVRKSLGYKQKEIAAIIGISAPYWNQMESNQRPASKHTINAFSNMFNIELDDFSSSGVDGLISSLQHAASDQELREFSIPFKEIELVAKSMPQLANAFIRLHSMLRPMEEGTAISTKTTSDYEYIESLEQVAENFVNQRGNLREPRLAAVAALYRVRIRVSFENIEEPSRFEQQANLVIISNQISKSMQLYQLLTQVALRCHADLIEREVKRRNLQSKYEQSTLRHNFANYFSLAVQMPSSAFCKMAKNCSNDVSELAAHFNVSRDHVTERLSIIAKKPKIATIPKLRNSQTPHIPPMIPSELTTCAAPAS